MLLRTLSPLLVALSVSPAFAAGPNADEFLTSGRLGEGEKVLADYLAKQPNDREARFGLGVTQFLRGVERLGRFLHRHGVEERTRQIPFFRLPIPPNPNPEPTSYADYRAMLEGMLADLTKAEATLAKIDGDVKLPVRFGQVRLDLNGDGKGSDEEALWRIYAALNRQFGGRQDLDQKAQEFRIVFDTGDAYWLRGYCHLLSALIEVQLAYDGQRWFDHCGHLLFAKAESPYKFLTEGKPPAEEGADFGLFLDAIAAIHLIDFELKEPKRMESARRHLLAMTDLSRKSWDAIVAETDDDAEWLPNPKQHSVTGLGVDDQMIATWRQVTTELDALLDGKKLVPFWRDAAQGVNLKRVFTEPKPFDLVLWVQGTAAVPYLEKGETTSPETWDRVVRVFRGEFVGFALWFN
jgi:hypothetical protein